ncbi:hypothetical protein QTP88_019300 [Uroleucon formosanum]
MRQQQSWSSKTINIDIFTPGIYYHFGLKEGIKNSSSKFKLDSEIKVMVGLDGLPLSKSSSSQFWPILANIYPHSNHVFPVGIYHGNEKPHDSNNYLEKFIHEAKDLILNGLELENILYKVLIRAFCYRFILTNKEEIVKVVNIAQLAEPKNKIIIIGYKFLNKVDFYNNPINSSKLDIWIVQDLSNVLQHWELTDIKSKMLILVHANENIAKSILHSNVQ